MFWREQTLELSRLLQFKGFWKPHVPFRYRGWKNPVKPVSVLFHQREDWSALKRFCQLLLDSRYFSLSPGFPRVAAIWAMQKSL